MPLKRTKLHRPRAARYHVSRSALVERLDRDPKPPLTLVSAPAGYGKSTLVSDWLEISDAPSAWLSLDKTDSDIKVFLDGFVAAVHTLFPEACEEAQALIRAPNLPPISALATCLVNELDAIETPFILALDDYHRVGEPAVHELLSQLLSHPPRPLHLVIVSRRDPPLPLSTMRARDQVTEARVKDLQFTATETKAYLAQATGVSVSDGALANLQQVVEGWAVGLHLVRLALRHQEDAESFLSGLHGGLSSVETYLVEEVLSGQSPAVRDWLLKTSVLNRFCSASCEAVCAADQEPGTSETSGDGFIQVLEEEGLFVIPLDTRNEWYRYHHLFQQLLMERLKRDCDAEEIAALHRRASAWFESQGLIEEAIQNALAAGDVVHAVEIIETYRDDEFNADRWYVVERWLAMLPAEIKPERPKLLLTEARIENYRHQFVRLPTIIEQVESLTGGRTVDPEVSGEIAFFRGVLEYWEGNAKSSRRSFEAAVAQLSGTRNPFGAESELYLGLAHCMAGNKELAIRTLQDRIDRVGSADSYRLSRLIASQIFVHLIRGDLPEARVEAQRLRQVAKKFRIRNTEAWSLQLWACTHLHTGELASAASHFDQAVALRYVLEPRAAVDALAGLALTQQLLRLDEKAAETVGQLHEFAQELNGRQYLSVAHSCRARISLLRGDLTAAFEWARSASEPPVPPELIMWVEAPCITQARVLVADESEESLKKATELLGTVRRLSESCRFTCQTIEVTVLQALALEKQGRTGEALEALKEAMALAEPGGWVRPFVELGHPMAELLTRLIKQNADTGFTRQILRTLRSGGEMDVHETSEEAARTGAPVSQPLLDPLTHREEEVLKLLAQRLSDKEIAGKLFVSPETVKSHLKNIYSKLHVGNRREAVARAEDLGILTGR